MAFDITAVKLNESNLGSKFVLKDISTVYRFDKNTKQRTDEKVGLKYHVFSPKLKNEVLSVTVKDLDPIIDIERVQDEERIVFVEFEGIEGKLFKDFKSGNVFLSTSASSVSVLQ